MNIIALLDRIPVDKSTVSSLSKEDFTQIKKDLTALQEKYPEIEDAHVAQLLKALKSHADVFQAVLNNRILFNYFANKDLSRQQFLNDLEPVEPEKLKSFVKLFFGEELNQFFLEQLKANTFSEISKFSDVGNFLPDNLSFMLKQHSLDKLDDAIAALKPPYTNFSKILYIKDRHFFTFLNTVKDDEVEQKVNELFTAVSNFHHQDPNSELANSTFLAMHGYNAMDSEFSNKIKNKKEFAETKHDAHIPKRKNLTWLYVLVGVLVFARIVFFIFASRWNDDHNYDDSTTYDGGYDEEVVYEEPPKIDPYYTNMKHSIDSFEVFLTSYKDADVKQLKQDVKLKTGENPFQTFYHNEPTGDSNNFIEVTNNTGYDLVLLENTVMYDSIKIPRSAHFIKAGDKLEINFNSSYSETIFNMYLGKKWATFQTTANKNLFIRKQSIVEYRFSQLIPAAQEILHTDYNLINDAVISYSNGNLNVESSGKRINPLAR